MVPAVVVDDLVEIDPIGHQIVPDCADAVGGNCYSVAFVAVVVSIDLE